MKKLILSTLVVFLSLLTAAQAGETFDRVLKDRVLRCAYTIYPPFFAKDPNTGTFSGIFHDVLEAMGKELSIDIQWTEEVGMDAILQGLQSGRYDAVCPGYFVTPSRANGGDFTKSPVYVPTYIYVRDSESRFNTFKDVNAEGVKMGTMDGEYSDILQHQRFPKTEAVSLMGLSSAAERFELVATGKADFTVAEATVALEYMAHNPDKIKAFGPPIIMGASTIIVPHDEYPLVAYLNAAIDSLLLSGELDVILDKHQKHEGEFLLPAKPYEVK